LSVSETVKSNEYEENGLENKADETSQEVDFKDKVTHTKISDLLY